MFRIEYEEKPKKWKEDIVKFADIEDAEKRMVSFHKKGINARIIEEGEEE